MRYTRWVAVMGLLALAACTSAPAPLTEADRVAIRAVDSAFAAAVNAGDLDAIVASYTPDAMVMPLYGPLAAGQGAIRETFAPLAGPGRVRLTLTTGTVDGSGDLAYVTGSYELQPLPVDSTQPLLPADVGKYLEVFRRMEDGSWKMVRDIWNTNAPPPAPEPAAPARR